MTKFLESIAKVMTSRNIIGLKLIFEAQICIAVQRLSRRFTKCRFLRRFETVIKISAF